ncbi:MAG: glycosyltransferase [Rickettsiales bacterium]|nr:glycosyltransferase [Rickettsiales bacterium]
MPSTALRPLTSFLSGPQKICAVMVTHNIGISVLGSLESLLRQAQDVIIVDNCSSEATLRMLEQWVSEHPGRAHLIKHSTNNLAMAQNAGIRLALQRQCDWVLMMDHDSLPSADMVVEMLSSQQEYRDSISVGIIAPYLSDVNSCRTPKYLRRWGSFGFRRTSFGRRAVLDDAMCVIASGSLIRRDLLEKVGLMDEHLCIDDIDRDFCLRSIKSGYRILVVRAAVLKHQLGQCRDHYMLGMRVTTTNHTAQRRYYIYRNRLTNWLRHGWAIPSFVIFDALAITYDLGRIIFLEADKRQKLRAAFTGMGHAIRGVKGHNPLFLPGAKPPQATVQATVQANG